MTSTRSRPLFSLTALTLLLTGGLLYAGPLDPPAGPVQPTFKTLGEVEPRIAVNAINTPGDADSLFKITQRGSYYLSGNITGVVGKHGIEIVASGVTLDLNGFDLVGVPAMGLFDGVSVTVGNVRNIAVLNGSVRNWGDDGVDTFGAAAAGSRVEGVLASGNTDNGLVVGINSTVINCSAHQNGTHGIYTDSGCTITNSSASTGHSLVGIRAGDGSTVANCSAFRNIGSGIEISSGSTVTGCSAFLNTGSGISVADGCTVLDSTARSNSLDGIVCGGACVIRGNTCTRNGNGISNGAGIHATQTGNRIEGNTCIGADRGIDIDAGGNMIIRNTCSANSTNWDVASSNAILVVGAVSAPAVLGSTGGAAPGSTDPHVNFSY